MTISRTVCLGFLAIITLGTILLIMPFSTADGSWNDPLVALFTSTSAVCVTGLVVVDTGSHFSFWGQLIIMLLIQLGGLGYMTITTFLILLVGRRFELKHKIGIQQALDRPGIQGSAQVVQSVVATTMLFELTGMFLLLGVFVPNYGWSKGLWFSIFHSVSAWNNAGFGLLFDNLISYQNSVPINIIIPLLIIFGGIGYQVIMEMFFWLRDRWHKKKLSHAFSLNFKVATSTTIALLIIGTVALFLTESNNGAIFTNLSLGNKLLVAWFQSVVPRTAGFNSIDYAKMTTTGLIVTIILMFIGASPGGTGGGIKTTTLRILSSATRSILQGKEEVELYQRQVAINLILKSIGVLVGSATTVAVGTALISFTDPNVDFIKILFESVSAFATVGLSTGVTAQFSAFAKLVLIATMYLGRVGVLLFMAALLGDPSPSAVRYPEENLLVG